MRATLSIVCVLGGYCLGVYVFGWQDIVSLILGVVLALAVLELHSISRGE